MKKSFLKIFTFVALVSFTSCGEKAKEAETKEAAVAAVAEATAVTYNADTSKSMIEWKGFKPGGSHAGTIAIKEGKIDIIDNAIKSGSFVINMTSRVNGASTIQVMSVDGKLLETTNFDRSNGAFEFNLSNYQAGVYLLQIQTPTGRLVEKVIVN